MVMVAAVPGPVARLQVTGPETVAVNWLAAWRAPAPAVNASNAASALARWNPDFDKPMEDLPFCWVLHDIAGRRPIFQPLEDISAS
jgi:hypothetical protein